MTGYILRRLLLAIPTLVGLSLIVFLMLHTAGGDPAVTKLGARADVESLARLRHEMGIDRPLAVQYIDFMGGAIRGDLGRSYRSNAAVSSDIWARFPATIELAIAAMAIALLIGIPAGVIAALRRGSFLDFGSTFGALLGVSIPTFWLGIVLILLFGRTLGWLPLSGRVNPRLGVDPGMSFLTIRALFSADWVIFRDAASHLVLPAVTLAGWPSAIIARMTRASLLETMDRDFVRTARAKGLTERAILRGHGARNAAIPVITVIGLELGGLLGGAVVTETVFAWPGIGKLTVDAINARDYQLTQGIVLVLGVTFVLINVAVDVLYAALDPRVKLR